MIYKPKYIYKWSDYTYKERYAIYRVESEYNGKTIRKERTKGIETEEGIGLKYIIEPVLVEIKEGCYFYYDLRVEEDLYKKLPIKIKSKAMRYEDYYNMMIIAEII